MSDNLQTGQLKQVIRSEFLKCAKSPAYFMKKYCQIQHPIRGKIPFSLYDYQERVLDDFVEHDYNIKIILTSLSKTPKRLEHLLDKDSCLNTF